MTVRLPAITALAAAVALTVASAATAQGTNSNPLSPGLPIPSTPAPTTTATVPTVATTSTGGGGVSSGSAIAIAIGAMVVLGGISLFIWRDARRRAPVRQRAAVATSGGPKQRVKPRKLSPAERRRRKRGRAR